MSWVEAHGGAQAEPFVHDATGMTGAGHALGSRMMTFPSSSASEEDSPAASSSAAKLGSARSTSVRENHCYGSSVRQHRSPGAAAGPVGRYGPGMTTHDDTRRAWETASQKHVREDAELLAEARTARLLPIEEELLAEVVPGVRVLHPQSSHGIDDHGLLALGPREVLGPDYSPTAVAAAQGRAEALDRPCRYREAVLPPTGEEDGAWDLVYTGKGALIWMEDQDAWAAEMHRVLRPGGHLFVDEAHPLVPLWDWDPEQATVRADRGYFAASHTNDTFPAHGATEHQRTLAELVMTVQRAGFTLLHLAEHPDPFWLPGDADRAAAWDGRLPNAICLLARRT